MNEQHKDTLGPEGSYFEAKARKEQEIAYQKMSALYPILIVFIYLVLGFVLKQWHPGWLIFFAIPIFYMRPKTQLQRFCNPVMITLIYLVIGVFCHVWHPTWLIFLVIPAAAIMDHQGKQG